MYTVGWAEYWDVGLWNSVLHWLIFSLIRQPFKHPYLHRTFWNEKTCYPSHFFFTLNIYFYNVSYAFSPSYICSCFLLLEFTVSHFCVSQSYPSVKVHLRSFFGGKAALIAPIGDILSPSLISSNTFSCTFSMALLTSYLVW